MDAQAKSLIAMLVSALRETEWQYVEAYPNNYYCQVCDAWKESGGHKPDCLVGNALKQAAEDMSGT